MIALHRSRAILHKDVFARQMTMFEWAGGAAGSGGRHRHTFTPPHDIGDNRRCTDTKVRGDIFDYAHSRSPTPPLFLHSPRVDAGAVTAAALALRCTESECMLTATKAMVTVDTHSSCSHVVSHACVLCCCVTARCCCLCSALLCSC